MAISLNNLGSKVYAKILSKRMHERSERMSGRPEEALDLKVYLYLYESDLFSPHNHGFFWIETFLYFCVVGKGDRVVSTKLWELLPRYTGSGALLQAVKQLYRGLSACMQVGASMSPWLDIHSGV